MNTTALKNILPVLFLACTWVTASAQNNTTDSIIQLLRKETKDTSRVLLLCELAGSYVRSKPDTALVIGQQALALARKNNFLKGEASSLKNISGVLIATGNYPKALETLLLALKIYEETSDKRGIATISNGIGIIYASEENYAEANKYFLKTKAISEVIKDERGQIASALNIGDNYYRLNKLDSALMFTQEAYKMAVRFKSNEIIGIIVNNLGNVYSKLNKPTIAMENYRLAFGILNKENSMDALPETTLGMAKLFEAEGKKDSCRYYAKKSLAIAQNVGLIPEILQASTFLSALYKNNRQLDSAYVYQEISLAAKDSLFSKDKFRQIQDLSLGEQQRQYDIEKASAKYEAKVRIYALIACVAVLLLIAALLFKNNRNKQKAYALLNKQKKETDEQKAKAEEALNELRVTQKQLIQSEKMASLGELTAGIAHEIQNPLNFVNNFSEVSVELLAELREGPLQKLSGAQKIEADEILNDIDDNLTKISHHGKRADTIVKGMLQHSRIWNNKKERTDINQLTDEYLRLSYHGLRAKDKSFNASLTTSFDDTIETVSIVPQDVGRVLLNLYNNAFYSVSQKRKLAIEGYEPTVWVTTKRITKDGKFKGAQIRIRDNGLGIPQKIFDKIFQPFFTTKPPGNGTGLGLSISYDIIKNEHGGELKVETKEGEYAEFIIELPM